MKSKFMPYLTGGLIGISLALVFAFKTGDYQLKISTADVAKINGIYIFTDCSPVKDYNVLGEVKKSNFSYHNPQYGSVRDLLVDRLKEQYPQADAGIFSFDGNGAKCEAIKFKE